MNLLTQPPDFIQAVATVGLIVVTAGLWWATGRMAQSSKETSEATKLLVRENSALRKDARKPEVLAKFKMGKRGSYAEGKTLLVLQNVGRGTALDVNFQLDGDEKELEKLKAGFWKLHNPIDFLYPGESEGHIFGSLSECREKKKKFFKAIVEYKDIDRCSHEKIIKVSVPQPEDWDTMDID